MCQAKNVLLRSDKTKLLIEPIKDTETDRIVIEYRLSTACFITNRVAFLHTLEMAFQMGILL